MSDIEFECDGEIGFVTLNRPEKRNAFSAEMRGELTRILRSDEVDELSALVLRAEGTVFSAGADLREVGTRDTWPSRAAASHLLTAFRRTGPVVIAAVRGPALGLGSGLAMACDLVVAGESAQFGYPEVEHGLVAALTMVGLKELVGQRAAFELLVSGRRIDSAEALELGMVNEIVADDRVEARALELARQIAARSGVATRTTKRFFYEIEDLTHAAAMHAGERVIELARRVRAEEKQREAEREGERR